MGYLMIAVIYKGSGIIGYRLLDTELRTVVNVPTSNLIQTIGSGKAKVDNLRLSGSLLEGTNGTLGRYPKCTMENTLLSGTASPIVIINRVGQSGYTVSDFKGTVKVIREPDAISYARRAGIANGKLVTGDTGTYISAISGTYETIPDPTPPTVGQTPVVPVIPVTPTVTPVVQAEPITPKVVTGDIEPDGPFNQLQSSLISNYYNVYRESRLPEDKRNTKEAEQFKTGEIKQLAKTLESNQLLYNYELNAVVISVLQLINDKNKVMKLTNPDFATYLLGFPLTGLPLPRSMVTEFYSYFKLNKKGWLQAMFTGLDTAIEVQFSSVNTTLTDSIGLLLDQLSLGLGGLLAIDKVKVYLMTLQRIKCASDKLVEKAHEINVTTEELLSGYSKYSRKLKNPNFIANLLRVIPESKDVELTPIGINDLSSIVHLFISVYNSGNVMEFIGDYLQYFVKYMTPSLPVEEPLEVKVEPLEVVDPVKLVEPLEVVTPEPIKPVDPIPPEPILTEKPASSPTVPATPHKSDPLQWADEVDIGFDDSEDVDLPPLESSDTQSESNSNSNDEIDIGFDDSEDIDTPPWDTSDEDTDGADTIVNIGKPVTPVNQSKQEDELVKKPSNMSKMDWFKWLYTNNGGDDSNISIKIARDIQKRKLKYEGLSAKQKFRVDDAIKVLEGQNSCRAGIVEEQDNTQSPVTTQDKADIPNEVSNLTDNPVIKSNVERILSKANDVEMMEVIKESPHILDICYTIVKYGRASQKQLKHVNMAIDILDKQ